MNLYKVSCCSSCGTYFASYLQSVTVIAENEKEALALVKKWLRKNGRSFVEPEYKKMVVKYGKDKEKTVKKLRWGVMVITQDTETAKVVDYHEAPDYY